MTTSVETVLDIRLPLEDDSFVLTPVAEEPHFPEIVPAEEVVDAAYEVEDADLVESSQERAIRLSKLPILINDVEYDGLKAIVDKRGARRVYGLKKIGVDKQGKDMFRHTQLKQAVVYDSYGVKPETRAEKAELAENVRLGKIAAERAKKAREIVEELKAERGFDEPLEWPSEPVAEEKPVALSEEYPIRKLRESMEANRKLLLETPMPAPRRGGKFRRAFKRVGQAIGWRSAEFYHDHDDELKWAGAAAAIGAVVMGGMIAYPHIKGFLNEDTGTSSTQADQYTAVCAHPASVQEAQIWGCYTWLNQYYAQQEAKSGQALQTLNGSGVGHTVAPKPTDVPTALPAFKEGDSVWSTVSAIPGLPKDEVAKATRLEVSYNHIKNARALPVGYRLKVAPGLGKLIGKHRA